MPHIDCKLHMVVYAQRRGEKGVAPDVVMHGVVDATQHGSVAHAQQDTWLSASTTSRGTVALVLDQHGGERTVTLKPGSGNLKDGDVMLRAEVRQVVDAAGDMTPTTISLAALQRFEGTLKNGVHDSGVRRRMRDALAELPELISDSSEAIDSFASTLERTPALKGTAFSAPLRAAIAQARSTVARTSKELRAALSDALASTTAPSLAVFEALASTGTNALGDLQRRMHNRESSLRELESLVVRLSDVQDEFKDPQLKKNPRGKAIWQSAQEQHAAIAAKLLTGVLSGDSDVIDEDETIETLEGLVAVKNSPALEVRGNFSVRAVTKQGALHKWVVTVTNTGAQPFNGTVVVVGADKNAGIGFESMACPEEGCSAQQDISAGGNYGATAIVGLSVRLGVRSLGFAEVKLPQRGTVRVDIDSFTVATNGQDRSEDFDVDELKDKRDEKFATGKVRFFRPDGKAFKPARGG